MKKVFIFVFSILTVIHVSADMLSEKIRLAVNTETECDRLIKWDSEFVYFGFRQGAGKSGRTRVISLKDSTVKDLVHNGSALDVQRRGSELYVLTPQSIEVWDLITSTRQGSYSTHLQQGDLGSYQTAMSFARFGNQLIIAHGRLGVSFWDMDRKKVTRAYPLIVQQRPLESMAMGVTIVGNYAYVALDNYTLVSGKPPFRGFVVVDMRTQNVVAELDGMDAGVDALSTDGAKIITSFMGIPIWRYSAQSLLGSQLPNPETRVWQFPEEGHPTGLPSLDDTYYYTCFLRSTEQGFQKVPRVLLRQQIGL